MTNSRLATVFGILLIAICLFGAQRAGAGETDYLRDVKPILKARCYACHGSLKQEAGVRLDSGRLIRQGGDSGPGIVPGSAKESLLLQRVTAPGEDERMPPEGEPLSAEQIELLRHWINTGANSPEGEEPEADPRHHWAFQPLVRPALPEARGAFTSPAESVAHAANASTANPIDAFLQAELARHALTARPAAPRPLLLRRVFLDLIGLPPTREELHAFLADPSEDAYETVVDRLLSDPRHGERWGRHWMDIWRYSDWYGRRDSNDVRNSASQMFRWRDWIVRSLNEGKGYDRMVQEMLAADEISPEDYQAGIATGYLIRNYYSLNANDWMRSAVEHTGKAFLGLTFNCAHCHDHKYDPIEHDDYFRMRAFFEPIFVRQDRVAGEGDPGPFEEYTYGGTRAVQRLGAVRVFDKQPDAPTWFYTGGDERNRLTQRGSIAPGVPAFFENKLPPIQPVQLPPRAWYPGLRPEIQQVMLAEADQAVQLAQRRVASQKIAAPDLTAAREAVDQARAAYNTAAEQAEQAGRPGALAGRQSLLLDAAAGRRTLHNPLSSLRRLDDGSTLEFELLILSDAHVNFQFAKDVAKGLTAGYLAFDQGRIMAYQPGSFAEFEAGRYDFAAGQARFHVSLVLQTQADRCLLTVRAGSAKDLLCSDVPIALNGWNPVGDESKAITFDARPGSVAVIDNVALMEPPREASSAQRLVSFDFEPPTYEDGRDVVGTEGWMASPASAAAAMSRVSSIAANPALRDVAERVQIAIRAADAPQWKLQAAESQLLAAHAERAGLQARIAADRARFGDALAESSAETVADAMRLASRLEREAALQRAEAAVLASEVALLDAEGQNAEDAGRAKAIEAASASLVKAKSTAEQARGALADQALLETYSPLSPQYPQQSTGRRRALAQWMTSRENPLTARVAVNHIWTRHFHSPLVASVVDFGRNGAPPTHPQLLDWLAVELMDSQWDMKHLHRLIVTSDAYRRGSSTGDAAHNLAIDPENKFLWRMNTGRMEAEVVRDSILHIAGRLDLTMGGVELENSEALSTYRRSLYYSVYPEAGGKSQLGELFDAPDPLDCYRRSSSIVPQQALALTNSQLVHQASAAVVKAWHANPAHGAEPSEQSPNDQQTQRWVGWMFEQILSRPPTTAEAALCAAALQQQQSLSRDLTPEDAMTRARESLVRILFNHNDFVTIR